MRYPKVLISVLNWNNAGLTIKCVHSILRNVSYPEEAYKIVIVDNASIDNSFNDFKAEFPDLQVIRSEENHGFAGGHFLSYKENAHNGFELLWILNNDILINNRSLPALVEAYLMHGNGIYGSISVGKDDKIEFGGTQEISDFVVPHTFADFYHNGRILSELMNPRTYWASTIYGFSMLIPTGVIEKYGYMSNDFFMYYEEFEFSLRMLMKYKVKSFIVQSSVVIHESSGSFKKSNNLKYPQQYYLHRNGYLLGNLFLGYKRRSYLKSDLKKFWQFMFLMIPRSFLSFLFPSKFIEQYYKTLGKFHFYINKTGKTLKPEDFL